MWHGDRPKSRLARALLTPLSWLYAGGWQTYLFVYRIGLKKPKEPHRPVVCVGNLTTGGSGKTPTTLYVARVLQSIGHEVVLGCSGYGSPHSEEASVAPEDSLDAELWGDEPAMMRWLEPDLPLIVGRNRVRAASLCHERFSNAVLLMDDGFQHLPVKKHVTIVLDPPSDNKRCIPAGPYREPHGNLRRASLVLPGSCKLNLSISSFTDGLGNEVPLSDGSEVNVVCALGSPQLFLDDLQRLGLKIKAHKLLPDHDPLQVGNLFDSFDPRLPIVVTAKDWVKIRCRNDLDGKQILVARQIAKIEPESEFKLWLAQKLDELSKEKPDL